MALIGLDHPTRPSGIPYPRQDTGWHTSVWTTRPDPQAYPAEIVRILVPVHASPECSQTVGWHCLQHGTDVCR